MSRISARMISVACAGSLCSGVLVSLPGPAVAETPAPPVELVEKRTPTSRTVRNGDGTLTSAVYGSPIHYRDRAGDLRPINSTVVGDSTEPGYGWRNEANSFGVRFKPRLGDRYLRVQTDGRVFGLTLEGARPSAATASGSRVSYSAAFPGVDLRYDISPDGLKETLVLAGPSAPSRYRFWLDPVGGPLGAKRLHGGAWAFNSPGHSGPIFVLAPPVIGESFRRSRAVAMDVRQVGRRFAIDLAVDEQWLRAPERQFPVLLDPTIVLQPSLLHGNWEVACGTCDSFPYSPMWIGGDEYSAWRAGVKFDLSDIPPGATVNSATLSLWNDAGECVRTSSGACSSANHVLDVHRMTTAWSWNSTWNQIGWDSAASIASTTVAGNAPSGWMSWNVKPQAQNWVSGTQANHGFLLKRSPDPLKSGGPGALAGDADDPTQAPKLEINYTSDAVKLYQPETLHSDGADLRWSPYVGANPFTRFEVHRSTTTNFTPSAATLIASIGDPAVTTYRDTTAAPGARFAYQVVTNGSRSHERTATLPADGQASKSIQLSPDSRATDIESDAECANFGADEWMYVGRDAYGSAPQTEAIYRPLLAFDLRDIPAGSTVTGATLSLYTDLMPPSNAVTVNVHRVTSSWKEGDAVGECQGSGANWLENEDGVKWKTPGADFDAAVLSSVSHGPSDPDGTWDHFNVTSAIQRWVAGDAPNHGLLLKVAVETPGRAGDWFAYLSDDAVEPTLRPKLSLTYTDGSHAHGPATSISSPAPAEIVSGTAVPVTAAASDDSRVGKVEFLVDGVVRATDTTAPYSMTWNTTTVTDASHSLSTRAIDDAGNVATSAATTVTVENSTMPSATLTAPAGSTTVSGTAVNVTANASGGRPISKVEFFLDGQRFAEDATAPYAAVWNTLDGPQPAYDGAHTLSAKAYDSLGRTASSTDTAVTVANTTATKFQANLSSTEFPQAVLYDPAAALQDKSGLDVTITNTSQAMWSANDVVLKYRWYSPDATPVVTDGSEVSLGTDLPAGQSRVLRLLTEPAALPDGVNKAQYWLRVDLYSKSSAQWFADRGNKPLENPVIVNKALVRGALGVEPYYHFVGEDLGAGMRHEVNVANGNSIVQWTPFKASGRGLDTMLTLTHNSLEKKCDCPAGNNFSLGISSLTRFGNPIDIRPNKGDEICGRSNKFIELTDSDGTTHRFTSDDGITYREPDGLQLFLRRYSTVDSTRKWALTTPDRTTYFYDSEGYPTSVEDRNGNRLSYTIESVPPAEDPGGPKRRITKVTDAGGRAFTISYWAKADKVKSHVRGKVKRITDHSGSPLDFEYYEDGNLRKLIQRGGTKADGSFLADRGFVFTYTTSSGDGPAIPLAANRVDPEPRTSNQSTRLFSVRDPRGSETRFSYLGSGHGEDRWKVASRTDRAGAVTTYGYNIFDRITTVTLPLSRVWKYGYDIEGKATSITNPRNQTTTQSWSADRMLTKVVGPTGKYVEFAYNANGLKTNEWDQLRNHTTYEYENLPARNADGTTTDTAGHISQLKTETAPKGTVTPVNDFQTSYSYDAKGNLLKVTDPLGHATSYTYNTDGTRASETDPNGRIFTYVSYHANGLETETRDAAGRTTRFGYDADGKRIWLQDPVHAGDTGPNPREYRQYFDYDSFQRLGATSRPKSTSTLRGTLIWTATEFDPNDNVTSRSTPGYAAGGGPRSTSTYDAMDRTVTQVGPDQSAGQERTEFGYDAAGRETRVTRPAGTATTTIANDYVTDTSYDPLDRITRQTEYPKDGSVDGARITNYCYDQAGDLRSETAPRGARPDAPTPFTSCPAESDPSVYVPTGASYTTKYTYHADHTQKSTTDPLGNTSTQTFDMNGNLESEQDAENNVRRYAYNGRDEMVQKELPFTTRKLFSKFEYDGAGNVIREVSPRAVDSQGAGPYTNYVTTYGYDAANQLAMVKHPIDASTRQAWTHYSYDPNGNQTSVSLPVDTDDPALVTSGRQTRMTYYDTGATRTVDYPEKGITTFDYTAEGQQSSRQTAGGPVETWTYYDDGTLKANNDPNGHPNTFTYDLDNNLVRTDDATGVDVPTESPLVSEQDYNGFDEPVEVRQRKEPPGQTPPPWRGTGYSYDANGNIQQRVDGGQTQAFGYDQADRFVAQLDANGAGCADDRRLTTSYLRNGWKAGETIRKSDGSCDPATWPIKRQSAWTYFANGDTQTLQTWKGDQAAANLIESHNLAYESNGVYHNGHRTADTFMLQGPDTAGCRLTTCAATFSYDARGRLTRWANGADGSATSYTLDHDTAGLDTLEGNVVKEAISGAGARTREYTYNAAGQVRTLSVNGTLAQRYFWDSKSGNIRCVADPSYTDDTCETQSGVRDWYKFDPLDRLKAFKSYRAGATVDSGYVYDALDRVSTETESHNGGAARSTSFGYLALTGEASSETRAGTTTRYAYDVNDQRVGTTTGTADYSFARNSRGDMSLLVDDAGAVRASYAYKPYGDVDSSISRGDLDKTSPVNPFRFNDKRFDSGSRTIDMGARRFDPDDGRFVEQDFLRDSDDDVGLALDSATENRYGFASGNPVTFAEVDGHTVESAVGRHGEQLRPSAGTKRQREQRAMNFFFAKKSNPLTLVQAAGIVGNFVVESAYSMSPGQLQICCTISGPNWGGCGIGLAQWTDDGRQRRLLRHAGGSMRRAETFIVQLSFAWKELTTTYKKSALDPLRRVKGSGRGAVHRATEIIKEKYEAPGVPNLEERKREAWRVYRQFGDPR